MQLNWQKLLNALGSTITEGSVHVKHPCPLHPESEPSLGINPDTDNNVPYVRCSHPHCRFTGDIIALTAAVRRTDLQGALNILQVEMADCLTEPMTPSWTMTYMSLQNTGMRTAAYLSQCQQALRAVPEVARFRFGTSNGSCQFLPAELGLLCHSDLPSAFREFTRPKYQKGQYVVYPYSMDGTITHVRVQATDDALFNTIPVTITSPDLGVYPESNLTPATRDLFVCFDPRLATLVHGEFAAVSGAPPPVVAVAGFPLPESAMPIESVNLLDLKDIPLTLTDALKVFAASSVVANRSTDPKVYVCLLRRTTAMTLTSETLQHHIIGSGAGFRPLLTTWIIDDIASHVRAGNTETACRALISANLAQEKRNALTDRAVKLDADPAVLDLIRTSGAALNGNYTLGNGQKFRRTPNGLRFLGKNDEETVLSNFDIDVDRKIRGSDGTTTYVVRITPDDKTASAILVNIPEHAFRRTDSIHRIIVQAYAERHESPYLALYRAHGLDWADVFSKLSAGCEVFTEVTALGVGPGNEFHFPRTTLRIGSKTVVPQQQLVLPDSVSQLYVGIEPNTPVEFREPFRKLFRHADNPYLAGFIAGFCHVMHRITAAVSHAGKPITVTPSHLLFVETEASAWQPVIQQLAYLFNGHEHVPRLHAGQPLVMLKKLEALGPLPWIGYIPRLQRRNINPVVSDSSVSLIGLVDPLNARELDGVRHVTFITVPEDCNPEVTVLTVPDLEELRSCLASFMLDALSQVQTDPAYRLTAEPAIVTYTALCRLLDVPVMATMKNQLKCYYTSTDSGVDEFFQVLHMFYEGTYIRRKTLRVSYAATVSEAVHNSSGKHVAVTPEYALIKHSILADITPGRHASFHPVSLTIALSERGLLLDAPLRGQIIADKFWVVSRDTWEEMIVRTPMTLLPVTPAQPIRPLSINIA